MASKELKLKRKGEFDIAHFSGRWTFNKKFQYFIFLNKLKLFKTSICVNFGALLDVKFQLMQIYDQLCVLSLNGHEGEGGSEGEVSIHWREADKGDGP